MARIEDEFFKFRGSIGDLSFTRDEFGMIVKMKAGKKRREELTQGTLESAMEMNGAIKMAREFRRAFNIEDKIWMDHYFSGRLNGEMRRLALDDNSSTGPRKLDLRRNGHRLEKFDCIRRRPLREFVGNLYPEPQWNAERTQGLLTLPELMVKKQITPPENATHISFAFAVVPVSNYTYDTQKKEYVPLAQVKFRAQIVHSALFSLRQKSIGSHQLELRWAEPFEEEVALVSLVGVRFYREMNTEIWVMKDQEAMRVLGVG